MATRIVFNDGTHEDVTGGTQRVTASHLEISDGHPTRKYSLFSVKTWYDVDDLMVRVADLRIGDTIMDIETLSGLTVYKVRREYDKE